ncbi:MAG: GGDEF domain-containing protein [Rhodospirillaceae bacterium]|nr:GGDEF domain-containing protein [Rhodospirillaceae bacterium]
MTLENEINTEIARTRVNALYKSGITGLIGITVAMILFVAFVWGSIDSDILFSWIGVFIFMVALRVFLTFKYKKHSARGEIDSSNTKKWENIFYYSLLTTGVVWATVILFPYEYNVFNNILFVTVTMVSLSGAAVALYSHSFPSMITYFSITMLPVSIRLILLDDFQAYVVAAATLIYYGIMIKIIRGLNLTLLDNIRLSIVNRNMSLRDPLTGLGNRRRLELFVEKLIPMSARKSSQFSVILMDIDHFKKYNDSEGHHAGDVLLCAVSEIITDEIRSSDLAIRFGGEEFLILMPETETEQAFAIAERISTEVMQSTDVTISGGVACHIASENFEETVRRADAALYLAKRNGRDLIEIAAETIMD